MKRGPYLFRRTGAELIGAYALVTAGCGAIIVEALTGALSHVGVALTFGLTANLGTTLPVANPIQSLGVEILLTAVLMFVITAVATDSRVPTLLAAMAIGCTVALDALWGGPISGASMNPARSFGPALVAGVWQNQWIYWLGPIMGASLGALIYQTIRLPEDPPMIERLDQASRTTQAQPGD
jgi:aquaporin NIP